MRPWIGFVLISLSLNVFGAISNQVVGTVGDQVITTRQVEIDYLVENILFPKTKKNRKFNDNPQSKIFESELNRILMEWVVYLESKSFEVVEVSKNDIKQSINQFNLKINKSKKFKKQWQRMQAESAEIKKTIHRKIQSKSFIRFKVRASKVPVTDAEAFTYYKENRNRFGSRPYGEFKENIKSVLAKRQADERLTEWFGILKKKYKVQKLFVNK